MGVRIERIATGKSEDPKMIKSPIGNYHFAGKEWTA